MSTEGRGRGRRGGLLYIVGASKVRSWRGQTPKGGLLEGQFCERVGLEVHSLHDMSRNVEVQIVLVVLRP
jgi:hypothetical protein